LTESSLRTTSANNGAVRHGGDALDRRAFDDEGKAGTGAERDVDAVSGHGLLQACIAAEIAELDLDAMPLEDAGALADIGRHERECLAPGLPDSQRVGGRGPGSIQ
jgi:hypothetical protein